MLTHYSVKCCEILRLQKSYINPPSSIVKWRSGGQTGCRSTATWSAAQWFYGCKHPLDLFARAGNYKCPFRVFSCYLLLIPLFVLVFWATEISDGSCSRCPALSTWVLITSQWEPVIIYFVKCTGYWPLVTKGEKEQMKSRLENVLWAGGREALVWEEVNRDGSEKRKPKKIRHAHVAQRTSLQLI